MHLAQAAEPEPADQERGAHRHVAQRHIEEQGNCHIVTGLCTLSGLCCHQLQTIILSLVGEHHCSTVQDDELASLQRSLQALSGPAQLKQPDPAVLSTSAGSGAPAEGDTGVFCKSAQAKPAQQGPRGKASYQGSAPRRAAASAAAQQPRPVISLVSSSLQQWPHSTVRQHSNPQLAGLAGPQQDQGGIPELASSGKAQHNDNLTQEFLQAQPDGHAPGKRAWQQRPNPCSSCEPSTQQRSQKAAQMMLSAQPSAKQMRMQASRSAGEVAKHTSRGTAEHLRPVAAVPMLQQQHQGAAEQSDGAGHPALTPPLEVLPYTVQEPDSPPLEQAGPRQNTSAAPQAQMPPTCIYTETTITRWALHISAVSATHRSIFMLSSGKCFASTVPSIWLLREAHWRVLSAGQSRQAGTLHAQKAPGQYGRCMRLEGTPLTLKVRLLVHLRKERRPKPAQ